MKSNKAAGLDAAITAEALKYGGNAMIDVIMGFALKFTPVSVHPSSGQLVLSFHYLKREISV